MKKAKTSLLDGKKLLLSILYSPGKTQHFNERIEGKTRLTKMVFLFEKEIQKKFINNEIELYEFEPYHYGPFSRQLLSDLEFFISIGFIMEVDTDIPIKYNENDDSYTEEDDDSNKEDKDNDSFEKSYFLSKMGEKYVSENIWPFYSNNQINTLMTFKQKINSISLDSLLRYVYNTYPNMAAKSTIAGRYLEEEE